MENKETKKQKKENKFFKWVKDHKVGLTLGALAIGGSVLSAWIGYEKGESDTDQCWTNVYPAIVDRCGKEAYFATRDTIDGVTGNNSFSEFIKAEAGGEKAFAKDVRDTYYESKFIEETMKMAKKR